MKWNQEERECLCPQHHLCSHFQTTVSCDRRLQPSLFFLTEDSQNGAVQQSEKCPPEAPGPHCSHTKKPNLNIPMHEIGAFFPTGASQKHQGGGLRTPVPFTRSPHSLVLSPLGCGLNRDNLTSSHASKKNTGGPVFSLRVYCHRNTKTSLPPQNLFFKEIKK